MTNIKIKWGSQNAATDTELLTIALLTSLLREVAQLRERLGETEDSLRIYSEHSRPLFVSAPKRRERTSKVIT